MKRFEKPYGTTAMESSYHEWSLARRRAEVPGVATLELSPVAGSAPLFIPGQFVNVLLPQLGTGSKSYSIASVAAPTLAITVRAAGPFSNALCAMREGERLMVSEPVGFFYPPDTITPRIFVAGGIGIVPFMSMLRAARQMDAMPRTTLLYSNRTTADIAFLRELETIQERLPLTVTHFLTREGGSTPLAFRGRIDEAHLSLAAETHPDAYFFLCGSIPFVRDMRLHLKALSIPEESIFTESFF